MNTHLTMVIVFISGLCLGWIGNTWVTRASVKGDTNTLSDTRESSQFEGLVTAESGETRIPEEPTNSGRDNLTDPFAISTEETDVAVSASTSVISIFNRLLANRNYYDAVYLYQEQEQKSARIAFDMKAILLGKLEDFKSNKNNSDFSELVESYLSVYYDDIDVLLLLADFNHSNGSYLEAVDVYLLAKTYAYTINDQQKVDNSFNRYVELIDSSFTNQKDWWSLINFYSHIDTSGLLSSTHQYNQAMAYLRSGDESFAVAQFNELLNDSLVGEAASTALNNLIGNKEIPSVNANPVIEQVDAIALQRRGNQYMVDLANNDQNSVKLLLDNGASMTALSRSAFSTLNADGDAVAEERRVFRTAGGVVMGTVYSFPELVLGPHILENTQVAVIDLDEDRDIKGLLGMNILGQFRFQIDQENARLLLRRK